MKSLETWGICAAGTVITFFGYGNYWNTTWLSKWAVLLSLSALAMSWLCARKSSFLYFPLILYSLANLIALGVWSPSPYQQTLDPVTLLALQKNALFAILQVSALLMLFCGTKKSWQTGIIIFLTATWATGVGSVLMQPTTGIHTPSNDGLWFGNPSMGASLLACLMPFAAWAFSSTHLLKNSPRLQKVFFGLGWFLTLLAIYRTGASVPWGVLGVVTAALLLSQTRQFLRIIIPIGGIALGMILLGKGLLGHDFWDQNGRFEIWRMAFDRFQMSADPWFGFGFSSGQTLIPIEQINTGHFHGDYFLWLHNDWLQLAVEGGYIGMFCVFLAVGRLLMVSFRQPYLFASLCGFMTLGLFNYPLRMPIHCFCLVLVCGLAEALFKSTRSVRMRVPTLSEAAQRSYLKPLSTSDLLAGCSCNQYQGLSKS